jgi:hypothetical protein
MGSGIYDGGGFEDSGVVSPGIESHPIERGYLSFTRSGHLQFATRLFTVRNTGQLFHPLQANEAFLLLPAASTLDIA